LSLDQYPALRVHLRCHESGGSNNLTVLAVISTRLIATRIRLCFPAPLYYYHLESSSKKVHRIFQYEFAFFGGTYEFSNG
jgi:hypothetical protein